MQQANQKIKVLIVTEEGRGGGAIHRIAMIAHATKENLSTLVVAPQSSPKFLEKLSHLGIRNIGIRLHPLTKDIKGLICYIIGFLPEIIRLIKIIRHEKPALVHANGSWQYKGIIAAFVARVPSVWHMNDMWQPRSVRMMFGLLSLLPRHYIYASKRTKAYYESISPRVVKKSSVIVPAPVDITRFKKNIKTKFSTPLHVVSTGYINAHKGLEDLIDVAAILGKTYLFHIIGPVLDSQQEYYESLLARIQTKGVTNIRWLGYRSDIPELLTTMDVYLCTSRRESSPMAVWEAMAASLPIVSTDVGDIRNINENYNFGYVVGIGEIVELANKIKHLNSDVEGAMLLGRNAKSTAVEIFSLDAVTDRYLSFVTTHYSSVL